MNGAAGTATRTGSRPVTPMQEYRIDGWLIQPALNRLVRGATAIRVRPQLIDVLGCLATRPGIVVSKEQLLALVWSDRFVAASGVARCVAELRQVLADDARQPRIIETISKRGYRLIARVEPAAEPEPGPLRAGQHPTPVPPRPQAPATGSEGCAGATPVRDAASVESRAWWSHVATAVRSLAMSGVVSALVRHGSRDVFR